MGYPTPIEWTDATWNPFGGCSVTSPGCTNCYAMRIAGSPRLRNHPLYAGVTSPSKAGPVFNGLMTVAEAEADVWTWPLRWRGSKTPKLGAGKPSMIFVGDMADLFHESRPDDVIDRAFATMALAPQHIFQVLTKRAERMQAYMNDVGVRRRIYDIVCDMAVDGVAKVVLIGDRDREEWAPPGQKVYLDQWPLPNVWLGVSVEDQPRADERIPLLLATPAAKRFISAEPMLGPVDLTVDGLSCWPCPYCSEGQQIEWDTAANACRRCEGSGKSDEIGLDWVISGGEGSPAARPAHPDWVRSLQEQCAAADVPFFFKQWGEWRPAPAIIDARGSLFHRFDDGTWCQRVGKKAAGALLDGREHREFPA